MRSFGSRRGNTAVRFMVEQTARRRLWANLGPERGDPSGEESDPLAVRWTRAFFERLRDVVMPRMAVVDAIESAELRFHGGDRLGLWGLRAEHEVVLAYEHGDTPETIRERARRWRGCLSTRTAPGLASRHWGHPVYGARLDPANGELDVVWAVPGDWIVFAASEIPAPRVFDVPPAWDTFAFARS